MEPVFKDIHQIGIVTKNLRETIMKFTDGYGISPWNIWEYNNIIVKDMIVRNKRIDYKMLVATCKTGNVDWEIVEPLDNNSIYYEFLMTNGEGLQHINYIVNNFNATVNFFKNKGLKIEQAGNLFGKHNFVYFNCKSDLKHIVELSKSESDLKRIEPMESYPYNKGSNITVESFLRKVAEIGIIVEDAKLTAKQYNDNYGIGPWSFYNYNPKTVSNMEIDGIKKDHKYIIAKTVIGKFELVLAQPLDDLNIFSKYLNKYGEGLHHIGFMVDDFNKILESIVKKGHKIMQSGNWKGQRYLYISSENDLKFVVKLIDNFKNFKKLKPDFIYPSKD